MTKFISLYGIDDLEAYLKRILVKLPLPRFSFDTLQTRAVKRDDHWDFMVISEGCIRQPPVIDPVRGMYLLEYHNSAWRIVSDADFVACYA